MLESFYLTNQPNIKHVTIELDTAKSVNTTVESPLYRFISNPDLETIEVSFKVEKNSNTGFIFSATSNPKLKTIRLFSGGERLHFEKLAIESNAMLEEVFLETNHDFTAILGLTLFNNPVLSNFHTTAVIPGVNSIYKVSIEGNNMLENLCPIQESIRVLDSILPNNPNLVIQNNAPGANSVAEVLAANCDYLVNSVKEEAKVEPMLLYPNPAQTSFSILGANSQTPVLIYNSLGMLVQQTQGNEIPIYNLPSGLYIVQWQNNLGAYQSQRLVKE